MKNFKNISLYLTVLLMIILGLYLIKIFDISYPLTLVTTTKSTELSVVGEGKVEATPDTAYVDAGVAVQSSATVEDVQKTLDKINNDIIEAMKKLGIDKADIKTSNYSINPNYKYENNENTINGYNGNATITIKVKNMQMVSSVISEATAAGANQIQGARFTIDKPEKFREEARDLAIANAKAQAEKLASTLGIRLGKIANIVESTPGMVYPVNLRAMSADGVGGGGGPAIEPGSQTVSSTVTLYFEKR